MVDGPAQRTPVRGKRMPKAHARRTRRRADGGERQMSAPHAMPKGDVPNTVGPGSVEAATGRLIAALDALEAAAERRRDSDRGVNSVAPQIQALRAAPSEPAPELAARPGP